MISEFITEKLNRGRNLRDLNLREILGKVRGKSFVKIWL